MRKLIIIMAMMAASAVGFAQVNASAAQPQNHSKRPDVRAIVGPSIAATDRSWRARIHYTYLQRDEDRRLDSHGLVKSDDVEVSTIIFFNGVPFEQLVEHNGRPPSPAEQRKQKDQLNKLKRETPEERVARLLQEEEDNASLVRMFSKVKGKLWVDKEDFGWIKADGQVTQPFSNRMVPGARAARLTHHDGADARRQWNLDAATHRNPSGRQNLFHKESHP